MATHSVSVSLHGAAVMTAAGEVVRVNRPSELPAALRQRSRPVVIEKSVENRALERHLTWLEFWQGPEGTRRYIATLIFALLALALVLRYGIDLNWRRDWKLDRFDGRITLTPPK